MRARARSSHTSNGSTEDGLSLVELIVTIMVTSLVMAIVGSVFVNVARVTVNSNATTTRSGIAANVMDEISKVLRTAADNPIAGTSVPDPAVVAGTPTAMTIYSFVDANPAGPAPTKVGFRIDAQNNLIEDRWTASTSAGYWVFTGGPSSRTVGGPILSLAGNDALFVYLDSAGVVLTPSGSGLSAADRAAVASIQITVQIQNQLTTGSDPIVIINTVGLANLKLSGSN
jgi:type II secretory pathway pseudopilin PulG